MEGASAEGAIGSETGMGADWPSVVGAEGAGADGTCCSADGSGKGACSCGGVSLGFLLKKLNIEIGIDNAVRVHAAALQTSGYNLEFVFGSGQAGNNSL